MASIWSYCKSLNIVQNVPLRNLIRTYCDSQTKFMPWERKQYIRRRGYEAKAHLSGLLPRIPGDQGPFPAALNDTRPERDWHRSHALLGQNDYIDILGDGSVHPSRLLTNAPEWLRGFSGTNELVMLNRKRQQFPNWEHSRPVQFHRMKKRVDYLYKYLNRKHRPPHPERYK
ncbi:39S ribosomal protein L51, mitochondrial [Halotydeus destructor]|nr:39S ribosomal protein L51, mitochondrial [Halotydeus destructor]